MTTPAPPDERAGDPPGSQAGDRAGDPPEQGAEDAALAPLVVVSGEATEEEVAALTAVVAALGAVQAPGAAQVAPPVSQWAARSRQLRGPHVARPGGWRSSTLPR